MNATPRWLVVSTVLAALLVGVVHAQSSGGSYTLTKHAVAGGGDRSSGGAYVVTGTAGQADAGPAPGGQMSGGSYKVEGGLWPEGATTQSDDIFADGFE